MSTSRFFNRKVFTIDVSLLIKLQSKDYKIMKAIICKIIYYPESNKGIFIKFKTTIKTNLGLGIHECVTMILITRIKFNFF
jgi:hypothetical protein